MFYSCLKECFKELPFVSSKAGKDVSQSQPGRMGRKWREIWGKLRSYKHQQRFPHIPPAASCTSPAIPASLPSFRGFIPLKSIFSSNQWPSKQHLENLCCWVLFFYPFFPLFSFLGEGNSWACWPCILPSTSRLHCTCPGWRYKATPLLPVPLDISPIFRSICLLAPLSHSSAANSASLEPLRCEGFLAKPPLQCCQL